MLVTHCLKQGCQFNPIERIYRLSIIEIRIDWIFDWTFVDFQSKSIWIMDFLWNLYGLRVLKNMHHGIYMDLVTKKVECINNDLRSSVCQDRLLWLSLMSIECEIMRFIDFSDFINEFRAEKTQSDPIE